jgi:NAD(P) transhydrogenase subunit alpha
MNVFVPAEVLPDERRVAATPETVRKWIARGAAVQVESGAGLAAGFVDDAYREAGAGITADPLATWREADLVLKVRRPASRSDALRDELSAFRPGSMLVCLLEPHLSGPTLQGLAAHGVTAFALELVPRLSRAQAMDVLSSQANLAGYRSVLSAAAHYDRAIPMMMTAAGTIAPARFLVMGAGVAGLQAIATARRLGGVVLATDVRPAAREQVESLGATFVMVESDETRQAETAGGYAREMSDAYQRQQAELIRTTLTKTDIVICTALIPGRPAPVLITDDMVRLLKPGSVIVDLAAEAGGNCASTVPGMTTVVEGVTLVGDRNVPSLVAASASQLFSRNVLAFGELLIDPDSHSLRPGHDDEILIASRVVADGQIVLERYRPTGHPPHGEEVPA